MQNFTQRYTKGSPLNQHVRLENMFMVRICSVVERGLVERFTRI